MPHSDPSNLFGFLIQDIARELSRVFEQQPGELNVSRAQARLLAYIAFYEGSTQTEFSALMDVQRITLTTLADGLEQLELIERRLDPADRRIRRLYMTPGARPVLKRIWGRLSDVSNIALAPLSRARAAALIRDLQLIREHLAQRTASDTSQKGSA